jgi:hypothetical protein
MKTRLALIIPVGLATASAAEAQFDLSWRTIDCGGGDVADHTFKLSYTIGQPDTATMSAGTFVLSGGFWPSEAAVCYANCDGSTTPPILNVSDFTCFLQRFATGDPYANCDGSTSTPVLNVSDFTCFLQKFSVGCP